MFFRKRKNPYEIKSIYNRNPNTGAYIIEVSLDNYDELFNGWDASPMKTKDLEPELLMYLETAGYEIPLKEKIELWFYLPDTMLNEDKQVRSIIGIKNNFKMLLHFLNKQLKINYRHIATYVTLSILFLVSAYLTRNLTQLGLFGTVLMEGMFIGGWFLLWEAFSLFFFSSYEINNKKKRYIRFLESEVIFHYRSTVL